MMNIFQDLLAIFSSFEIIDIILYVAVVTLIVLVVSLIYVLKNENEEELTPIDGEDFMNKENEKQEEIDLHAIVDTINENPKPLADMTAYEEEQERKAIISYDELVRDANKESVLYDDEKLIDDIIPVKKIQTANLELPRRKEEGPVRFELPKTEPPMEVETKETSKLFSYEKEEAFLKALKELNELLN